MKSALRTGVPRGRHSGLQIVRSRLDDLEKKVELLMGSKASVEFVAQYGQDLHSLQDRIDAKVDVKLDKYGERMDAAFAEFRAGQSAMMTQMNLLQTSFVESQAKLQLSVAESQAQLQSSVSMSIEASVAQSQAKTNAALVKTQASIDTSLATGFACFVLPMALWFVCEIIPKLAAAASAAQSSKGLHWTQGLLLLVVYVVLNSTLMNVIARIFASIRGRVWQSTSDPVAPVV